MRMRTVSIEVPESWLDYYQPLVSEIAVARFKNDIEKFLHDYAPCAKCLGSGFVTDRYDDEIGCDECNGKEWESPL